MVLNATSEYKVVFLYPGPMRGGSSRNIVPGPGSYGGARDWKNIWLLL